MIEAEQAKESTKSAPRRLGLRRFSTVELPFALALLFVSFPFVEEVKGGDIIVSILLSLVLLSAVLAVSHSIGLFLNCPVARSSSDRWQVDQPFSTGLGPACRLPCLKPCVGCFRRL